MGSDPFVAEIGLFAGNFAPTGWATCDGQLLPLSQNTALFSLLGTFYGGDGKSTFALPDLQGRSPIHTGQGPGLTQRFLGESGGQETVTPLVSNFPQHSHLGSGSGPVTLTQLATTDTGNSNAPGSKAPAGTGADKRYSPTPTPNATMAPYTLQTSAVGSSSPAPFSIMQPYLTLTFCIALQGVFPPRS